MPQPVQTYKNHTRRDILYMIALVILLINLCVVTYTAVRYDYSAVRYDLQRFSWLPILWVAVAFATLVIGLRARTNALKAQDRTIRLEERLRYAAILPADLALRAHDLTIRQIVALRFASDAELPALIDRTLTESLTPKQIKQSIVVWRPDHDRV